jgi:m7GpppX diphosphatase
MSNYTNKEKNMESANTVVEDKEVKRESKKIYRETYADYMKKKELILKHDDRTWIYNIIDGIDEQQKILYDDNEFIIVPSYVWDSQDIFKLHILAIFKDKSIHCIRELNGSHIHLLNKIKCKTLSIIKKKYKLNYYHIKMFIHYSPSTYQFHIHFANIYNKTCNSSCEYSHELNDVIFNLELNSNYYKIAPLNIRN